MKKQISLSLADVVYNIAAQTPCWPNRWQHSLTINLAVVAVETAVVVAAKRRHQLSPARSRNLLSLRTAAVMELVVAVAVIGHPTL